MFNQLLLAVDSSDHSKKALGQAIELAKLANANVRVLHVRDAASSGRGGPVWHESSEEAAALVDETVSELQTAGIESSGVVRDSMIGATAREILDEAQQCGASLIVIGSRGHSEFTDLVIGSVAHKVLNHGSLPVLVVR